MDQQKLINRLTEAGVNLDWLTNTEGPWTFEIWDMFPGPSPHDFICVFNSQQDALHTVYDYHFGEPTIFDGWIVPLHKHPELTVTGVEKAVQEAVNISKETFEGIAERRRKRTYGNRLLGSNIWEWALQYQFLPCHHTNNKLTTLRLRRDMQETYIVHTSTL